MLNGQNSFTTNPKTPVKIKVINDLCISAATCLIKAPETFDLDSDGIAYVLTGDWDDVKSIVEAAMSCPTTAIIVEDLKGNVLWPLQS